MHRGRKASAKTRQAAKPPFPGRTCWGQNITWARSARLWALHLDLMAGEHQTVSEIQQQCADMGSSHSCYHLHSIRQQRKPGDDCRVFIQIRLDGISLTWGLYSTQKMLASLVPMYRMMGLARDMLRLKVGLLLLLLYPFGLETAALPGAFCNHHPPLSRCFALLADAASCIPGCVHG